VRIPPCNVVHESFLCDFRHSQMCARYGKLKRVHGPLRHHQ
jgi:hypothetical protein